MVVTVKGPVILTIQEIRPVTTSKFPTVSVILDIQVCMAILVVFKSYKFTPFHEKIKLKNKNGLVWDRLWTVFYAL